MAETLIIRHSIDSLGQGDVSLYLTHLLCLDGTATINFNDMEFAIERGGCCIIRTTQLIEGWKTSEDFRCVIVYADLFNFPSASYFTRNVQRYLGESPSEYRG